MTVGSDTDDLRGRMVDPLQRVRETLPQLRGASRRVAEAILADPDQAANGSITRLAATADTTAATVTRLAGALGFNGFPALRAAIAMENGRVAQSGWERDIGTAIHPEDTADQVLNVLAGTEAQALRNALATVDLDAAVRLAEAIAAAGRVHIYSDWGDSVSARELYLRLLRIGVPVWYCEGSNSARAIMPLLGAGDVALMVSRSGSDPLGQAFLTGAAERGALAAVITGEPDSAVADCCDVVLYTGTRNGRMWTEYFAGRASDVLVAGLVFVLVAQRMPDRAQPEPGADGLHLVDEPPFSSQPQPPSGDEKR